MLRERERERLGIIHVPYLLRIEDTPYCKQKHKTCDNQHLIYCPVYSERERERDIITHDHTHTLLLFED